MNDLSGSQWRKWDLHFHTPNSFDYSNKGLKAAEVVDRLIQANIAVVVVTDHHKLDATFIREMQESAKDKLTVLPGIELASNLGGDEGVHFIAIFSESSDLNHLSSELMVKLNLSTKRVNKVPEERLYVEFPTAAKIIQDLGGLISIHGHGKADNYETISSKLKFKQEQKTDLLREYVDIIEVGNINHAKTYHEKIFPSIGFQRPIVIGSDDHARAVYPKDKYCWIKADPTFAGIKMALRKPETRFCLDDVPLAVDRLQKNKTRYIKSVSFAKKSSMPSGEEWLQGVVPFNSGLVAVIGNKGSGKSALTDCLGLLGSCGTSSSFSFLDESRFCDPKTGRAQHVEATLKWHDGSPRNKSLIENVNTDEPERVKYLPQRFVETVCNGLTKPGGGEFESELKKVVFSKVPKADQLGKRYLDELVYYRTQEIRREAESLASGLITLAERWAYLEDRLDPSVKSALEKQIAQIEEQIKSHEAIKPLEIKTPSEDPSRIAQSKAEIEALRKLQTDQEFISAEIEKAEKQVVAQNSLAAQAVKLLEKLKNLKNEFERRKTDIASDAASLGLDVSALVKLKIDRTPVEKVRDTALHSRDAAQAALDGPLPNGFREKKNQLDDLIRAAQERLDRPNQEYQAYVKRLANWKSTLTKLKGSAEDPNSLLGLKADLEALAHVPTDITAVKKDVERVASEIHKLRVDEANVYTELYGPVQKFVAEHPLAQKQLKIDFRVELIEEGFIEKFLSHINQQRVGSFSGVDEGHTQATKLVAPVNWAEWTVVEQFLRDVVDHLHNDRRSGCGQSVMLKNQIGKGKTAAELYAWLYSQIYVKPRYVLKSDGKKLEQLSPGERGALLLVFYLLVDDTDVPLIIDQPEANLDNFTVAEKLVACIQNARERRQVIIVTHNPNLAVVCDADQIIYAAMDIAAGHRITYTAGALENPIINELAIKVLEGGRPPFSLRDDTYRVCDQ